GWSFEVLLGRSGELRLETVVRLIGKTVTLVVDSLSAFFILVVNITLLVGLIYASGYLKPYYQSKNALRFSIHYFSYLWLYFSMVLVLITRDGLSFLIVWEIMALSSFMLVIFDAEDTSIMKTGISYLIQMHVGMFFLMFAFLILEHETGEMSFDALGGYFRDHSNLLLFILFFIGFGIKAGFIPLHTWLPQAHPAAPSHVSGVMSGVMIKMGIYGIMRVLLFVSHDLMQIGILILIVSLVSGLLGVMMAIVQHDLKRLLAYHSIENIGIIGIGIGLGVIGLATGNNALSILGFSGGLLHVLNHSLFKSLLFFSAGSVYTSIHTRNIEKMGGLMKRMPYTSVLFLIGSLAICGLPPFNGFISEYIIYLGMFRDLPVTGMHQSILVLGSIVGLSLIGGLAVFCFTKAFGIAFLGEPRSQHSSSAVEVGKVMIFPQLFSVALIILIGVASPWFVRPVFEIVSSGFGIEGMSGVAESTIPGLSKISLISGVFIMLVLALSLYRQFHLKSVKVSRGPTWGCGYTAPDPKQQYTSTSFAYNYNHLAKPVIGTKKMMPEIMEEEIFPEERSFSSASDDVFQKVIIDKPAFLVSSLLKKIAVMQTGKVQHYILYAFIFMLIVLLLTWLNII
ncbi:MAG TPA: NADH-quinone oxidoreductase subunit E, partial [Bacteroidales bacterium]|nr:NADH-quinone oxidoreductase subunit E [Bacteroidales bacterium]